MKELTAKLRALDFAVKGSDEVVKTNSSEAISRHEQSIVTKINTPFRGSRRHFASRAI